MMSAVLEALSKSCRKNQDLHSKNEKKEECNSTGLGMVWYQYVGGASSPSTFNEFLP